MTQVRKVVFMDPYSYKIESWSVGEEDVTSIVLGSGYYDVTLTTDVGPVTVLVPEHIAICAELIP
jgi:hypothetical protein